MRQENWKEKKKPLKSGSKWEEGRRGRAGGGQRVQPASGVGYTSVSGGTLAVSLGVNSRVAPAERASHGLAGDFLPSG